jgi:hypothetical protein
VLWICLGVNADPYPYLATDPDPIITDPDSGVSDGSKSTTLQLFYLTFYKTVQSGSAVITNQLIGIALLGTAWIKTKLN